MGKKKANTTGIQSIERAIHILEAIKKRKSPITLTELAELVGMGTSSLQKYLFSFVKTGVLTFDEKSKVYTLGPKLIELGLSALNSLDDISHIYPYLEKIRDKYNQSSALAVWTEHGPMIVKYQKSKRSINVHIEEGFSPPLLVSSIGKCFAAFLPFETIQEQYKREIEKYGLDEKKLSKDLEKIRTNKLSIRDTNVTELPGNVSVSCPIFNHESKLIAVIGIVGFNEDLIEFTKSEDENWLQRISHEISEELGYRA